MLVTFEFFCVAYLLLIIGVPSRKGIRVLPIFKDSLKLLFHSAVSGLIDGGLYNFTALVWSAYLLAGWFGRAGLAACCIVLLEMMVFGCEVALGVVA